MKWIPDLDGRTDEDTYFFGLDDLLALYPEDGPDAGTGPRSRGVCECGHEVWKHHQTLGACMVVIGPGYCRCLEYRQVQG